MLKFSIFVCNAFFNFLSTSPFRLLWIISPSQNAPNSWSFARPKPNEHSAPLSIGITFKSLITYITTAAFGLTTLSALFLIWKHLHRYTTPKEQRQNLRIIAMPVFFGSIALLSILFYLDSTYFKPLIEVYEFFHVAVLFFLYVEYVTLTKRSGEQRQKGNVIPGGSLKWFISLHHRNCNASSRRISRYSA